jgi:hypothetical protein
MNKIEKQIIDLLASAYNNFIKLEVQHPSELKDFSDGIHLCQYIIATRLAREKYEHVFPIKR